MIKRRSLFTQQIKYRSDEICHAVATTENDTTVEKNSTNILDKGGIRRPFQPCLEHTGITRSTQERVQEQEHSDKVI